ncbi:hypothetical protein GCM10027036_32410 [Flavihumibacter cheonanensis]|uniref:hypothetical protein n=1 Tax=Flavihumibacter cheonanensis TaxID=1442385 RepID=UPI001EF91086|nr:hypothetical protein [Flavihumibacter cheonanensis]MCG7752731.1 hypothetical protein [Flavihumibacter cheonanensis]
MTNPIRNHDDLLAEKARLKSLLLVQKNQLRRSWEGIEEELEPATKFLGSLSLFSSRKSDNPLLKLGLDLGIDMVMRKTLFRQAGFLTRLGAPILVRNLVSNLFDKKGAGLLAGIKSIFRGKKENASAVPS